MQSKPEAATNNIEEKSIIAQFPFFIVWLIEEYKRLNKSVYLLLITYNDLNRADIFDVLAYYHRHQQEIEKTIQYCEEKRQRVIAKSLYPDEETYQYMQKQGKIFDSMLSELIEDYEGYYVYFEDGKVLEADTDEEKLLDLVEKKYGFKPMFIEKVEANHTLMMFYKII